VGERFAVRNSGATAVVEGVGDHGCEYMTGGTVVVLGRMGRNFGAGMSGGTAYVYDPKGTFDQRINADPNLLQEPVTAADDIAELKQLIEAHNRYTGSKRAARMIAQWDDTLPRFVKVISAEYKTMSEKRKAQALADTTAASGANRNDDRQLRVFKS
jgi:glutamate synthase domain-containing protein 3